MCELLTLKQVLGVFFLVSLLGGDTVGWNMDFPLFDDSASTTTPRTTTTPPFTTTTPPFTTTTPPRTTTIPPSTDIWAVLVAGSNGFYNYRHQADVCHAYQILRRNGIPEENIIVMMYDDIAYNNDNPKKGVIINKPGGSNVYEGVKKDYVGDEVNSTNFLNILRGNKNALDGIGSGRVVESNSASHIFVNFVDHGGPGALMFPDDELLADDFISVLKEMAENQLYKKMILYVEACYSGSMFETILPDDLNIFVTTAADPRESSYACYYDDTIGTYLGDVFSVNWMEDSEMEDLKQESLNHQFELVRSETKQSHVELYGDLDIGSTKLVEVFGMDFSKLKNNIKRWRQPLRFNDVVVSHNVTLSALQKKLERTKGNYIRQEIKIAIHHILKRRQVLDELFDRLISNIADKNKTREQELMHSQGSLHTDNFLCYKTLFKHFSENCLKISKNPYVTVHLEKFVNFCDLPWTRLPTMLNAIDSECSGWQNQFIGLHAII